MKFKFRDLFINFLHKQVFYPYVVTKPDFSDFGLFFGHHISKTNLVIPQFFDIVIHNLKLVKVSEKKINVRRFLCELPLRRRSLEKAYFFVITIKKNYT